MQPITPQPPITATDSILTAFEKLSYDIGVPGANTQVIYNNGGVLAGTNYLTITSQINNSASIIPTSTAAYNLGAQSLQFNNTYTNNAIFSNTTLGQYAPNILTYTAGGPPQSISKDRNILYVRLANAGPDEFTSVAAAVTQAATIATSAYPITVQVSPGVYTEPTIVMAPYILLTGTDTIIQTNSTGQHVLLGADNSEVSNLTIGGSSAGFAAVYYSSPNSATFTINDVTFSASDILVLCEGQTSNICSVIINNATYSRFTTGFYSTNQSAYILVKNSTSTGIIDVPNITMAKIDAPGCTVKFMSVRCTKQTVGGTGVYVTNGGTFKALSASFNGWNTGLYVPNLGAAPNVIAVGMEYENSALYDVNVLHTGTTGYIQGINNGPLTYINETCPFYIVGVDSHIITVAIKGGDYSSVAAAVNSITDASSRNLYLVSIGPGIFVEGTITMKQYVILQGAGLTTVIACNAPNINLIVGAPNSAVYDCILYGTSGSGSAVYYNSGTFSSLNTFALYNVRFGLNTNLATVDGTVYPSILSTFNNTFGDSGAFTNGFNAIGSAGLTMRCDNIISNTTVASAIIQSLKYVAVTTGNSAVTITYTNGVRADCKCCRPGNLRSNC